MAQPHGMQNFLGALLCCTLFAVPTVGAPKAATQPGKASGSAGGYDPSIFELYDSLDLMQAVRDSRWSAVRTKIEHLAAAPADDQEAALSRDRDVSRRAARACHLRVACSANQARRRRGCSCRRAPAKEPAQI